MSNFFSDALSSANSFFTGNNASTNPTSAWLGAAIDPIGQPLFSAATGQGVGQAGSTTGQVWNYLMAPFKPPAQPTLQTPGAAPTQQSAAQAAIPDELASESKQSAASSYLTGGQGLLDQPTTASRSLLGY